MSPGAVFLPRGWQRRVSCLWPSMGMQAVHREGPHTEGTNLRRRARAWRSRVILVVPATCLVPERPKVRSIIGALDAAITVEVGSVDIMQRSFGCVQGSKTPPTHLP